MEKNTYISDLQKKKMWKRLVTTARFVLCQRCTSCSQQSYTTNRLYSRLDQARSADQGGFRRAYQTLDHLATCRLLEQKCREWSIKMWVATVDVMKAFESIRHQSLWTSFEKMRNRIALLMPLEEIIRGTERVSLNGQRK